MNQLLRLYMNKAHYIIVIILCIMSIQKSQAQERQAQTITFVSPSITALIGYPYAYKHKDSVFISIAIDTTTTVFRLRATSSAELPVLYSAASTLVDIRNDTVIKRGIGTVSITAYNTGNATYAAASAIQILTITKTTQTLTFLPDSIEQSRTFGDRPFRIGAFASSALPVEFSVSNTLVSILIDTITGMRYPIVTIHGVGTVSITTYNTGNQVYLPGSASKVFTIHSAAQSINFETRTNRTFGDAPFVLQASSSARLPVLFSASNTIVSISNNTVSLRNFGTVSITAYNTGDHNYSGTSAIQTLIINGACFCSTPRKTTPVITFAAIPNMSIGQRYVLMATSNSAAAIRFTSSDTNKVSIRGYTAMAKTVGNVVITASQEENIEYNAATATQNVTVNTTPTLTFAAIPNLTVGQKHILTATSNSSMPITFTASDTNILTISGDTATAKATGSVTITASQEGNIEYNATNNEQIVTVVPPPLCCAYPFIFTAPPTLTVGQKYVLNATSNSPMPITFSSNNTSILSISGNTATAKAMGTVTITARQEGNAEHDLIIVQRNVTVVNPPPATLTFIEKENDAIIIHPNPAKDYFTIQADKTQKVSSVKIYDINGREVMVSNEVRLDIKTLSQGEYIIIIYGEKGEVLKAEKIIKE